MASASFVDLTGVKRPREDPDWATNSDNSDEENNAVEIVPELKREIEKLRTENKNLKKMLKEANRGKENDDSRPATTQASLDQTAARLRKSMITSINAQMVYKPSLKHGSSRVTVEIPNINMAEVCAILGSDLFIKASKGAKQVTVKASNDELYDMLGCTPSKSLRYGACLTLKEGLKFTYVKEERVLEATGMCYMEK